LNRLNLLSEKWRLARGTIGMGMIVCGFAPQTVAMAMRSISNTHTAYRVRLFFVYIYKTSVF
jgi:hypothetical protein